MCLYLWLSLSMLAKTAGLAWLVFGVSYGAWKIWRPGAGTSRRRYITYRMGHRRRTSSQWSRRFGSSAGHNGMKSIIGALGTEEITRMRLGIAPEHEVRDRARYVLAQFKKSQYEALDKLLDTAADALEVILSEGATAAMSRFNARPKDEAAEPAGGS